MLYISYVIQKMMKFYSPTMWRNLASVFLIFLHFKDLIQLKWDEEGKNMQHSPEAQQI